MARNYWHCEKCNGKYDFEEMAIECERKHPVVDKMKLEGIWFDPVSEHYGANRGLAINVPRIVRIRFSDNYGDFATYKLERYGVKGV